MSNKLQKEESSKQSPDWQTPLSHLNWLFALTTQLIQMHVISPKRVIYILFELIVCLDNSTDTDARK
jgi:hypothetical protein